MARQVDWARELGARFELDAAAGVALAVPAPPIWVRDEPPSPPHRHPAQPPCAYCRMRPCVVASGAFTLITDHAQLEVQADENSACRAMLGADHRPYQVPSFRVRNHSYYKASQVLGGGFGRVELPLCVRVRVRALFVDPPGFSLQNKAAFYTQPQAPLRALGGRMARKGVVPPRLQRQLDELRTLRAVRTELVGLLTLTLSLIALRRCLCVCVCCAGQPGCC